MLTKEQFLEQAEFLQQVDDLLTTDPLDQLGTTEDLQRFATEGMADKLADLCCGEDEARIEQLRVMVPGLIQENSGYVKSGEIDLDSVIARAMRGGGWLILYRMGSGSYALGAVGVTTEEAAQLVRWVFEDR